jgi:hypothetical protein
MARRKAFKNIGTGFGNSLSGVAGGFVANFGMDAVEGNVPFFAKNPFAAPSVFYIGSLLLGMTPKMPKIASSFVKGVEIISGVEVAKAAMDFFKKPASDTAVSGAKTRFDAEINPVR